jgi:hypothetical protein
VGAFFGANSTALAEVKIGRKIIIHVDQALRGTVEGTKPTVSTLLPVRHRPTGTPAPGIQTEEQLIGVRPATLKLSKFFHYHHLLTFTSWNPLSVLRMFL